MDGIRERLEGIGDALLVVLQDAFAGDAIALPDPALLDAVRTAADVVRKAEGVLVAATAEVQARSESAARDERLATRLGCRSVGELLQRATRFGSPRVTELERAARGIRRPRSLAGETLDPTFPALRDAMRDGILGADAAAAAMAPLQASGPRIGTSGIRAADAELAAAARGAGPDAAPPATAGELRVHAQVWAAYLDQDGAEPREERAFRRRGLTLGRSRDGIVPVRGGLLPEVAAQLERLMHSILNPKTAGGVRFAAAGGGGAVSGAAGIDPAECGDRGPESPRDIRTRAQKQHDAFAVALAAAAASGGLPEIGGAAPTLVVTVRAEDLASGSGFARVSGSDEPVPVATARHTGCVGNIQRVVLGAGGRIVSLGFAGRIFTAHQRRAILARDGGCLIPGCDAPPEWCEIHHVEAAARGGPTHTDNGVALCWHHHRTLETSGWQVRMRRGVPEVRGPAWWDPVRRWRPGGRGRYRLPEGMGVSDIVSVR